MKKKIITNRDLQEMISGFWKILLRGEPFFMNIDVPANFPLFRIVNPYPMQQLNCSTPIIIKTYMIIFKAIPLPPPTELALGEREFTSLQYFPGNAFKHCPQN